MKANKKVLVSIIVAATVLFSAVLIAVYWYNHPTHYLYEDRWIIGKTAEQIEERYGEFDRHSELITGGFTKEYCVKPLGQNMWGDPVWPRYYEIYFDETGIAYKVEIFIDGRGG